MKFSDILTGTGQVRLTDGASVELIFSPHAPAGVAYAFTDAIVARSVDEEITQIKRINRKFPRGELRLSFEPVARDDPGGFKFTAVGKLALTWPR